LLVVALAQTSDFDLATLLGVWSYKMGITIYMDIRDTQNAIDLVFRLWWERVLVKHNCWVHGRR